MRSSPTPAKAQTAVPPEVVLFNLDNEKAMLCAMLRDPGCIEVAASIAGPSDFSKANAPIYLRTLEIWQSGNNPDLITVIDSLRQHGELENVGGPAYVSDLLSIGAIGENVRAYARPVRKVADTRRALEKIKLAYQKASNGNGGDPFEPIRNLRAELDQILESATESKGPRFRLETAGKALQPQPPIQWLLQEFLARRWVSIWYGEPGCKKTWALLDQAVSLAMGKSYWLKFRAFRSTVLLVDEESGEPRLLRRLGDTMRAHEAPANIPLHYISLHGFNLTSDQGAAELESLITEVKPTLVIIDALADVMLGGDENSVQDTQPVLVRLRRIAERQDCAIEVIHHVNKAGDYRGSTALKGAVDTMIAVESRTDSQLVTFTAEKTRDIIIKPFGATAHFSLGNFHLSDADPETGQAKLSPSESYVLRYLENNGASSIQAIMNHADACSPETARRALYNLANRLRVRRTDEGGQGKEATYELVQKN